jgi:magnesium transporter
MIMKLTDTLTPVNPITLADILFHKGRRAELFLKLPQDKRPELLRSMPLPVKKEIAAHIPDNDLVDILEAVAPDEATDILQLLPRHKRELVLQLLSGEVKDSLSTLLEFDPATAAGLMTLDYIQADISETVTSVAEKFNKHERRTGRPPVILVLKEGRLAGFLPGHALAFADKDEPLDKYVKHVPSISYAANHQKVIQLWRCTWNHIFRRCPQVD